MSLKIFSPHLIGNSQVRSFYTLDISNQKMYNINRVGENITSIEEYDVASINSETYAVSTPTLVGRNWLDNTKAGQIIWNAALLVLAIISLVVSIIGCGSPYAPVAVAGVVLSAIGVLGSLISLLMAIF